MKHEPAYHCAAERFATVHTVLSCVGTALRSTPVTVIPFRHDRHGWHTVHLLLLLPPALPLDADTIPTGLAPPNPLSQPSVTIIADHLAAYRFLPTIAMSRTTKNAPAAYCTVIRSGQDCSVTSFGIQKVSVNIGAIINSLNLFLGC